MRESVLRHERMRFDTMSRRQLFTRLGKMNNPAKLRAFITVALEYGFRDLSVAAQATLSEIEGREITVSTEFGRTTVSAKNRPVSNSVLRSTNSERLMRKIDQ